MGSFQDLFSSQADFYARSRPRYPAELFTYLAGLTPRRRCAWDCGTGNGQAAVGLAEHFEQVIATDASSAQLALATPHPRVEYRLGRAEDVHIEPGSIDLVAVATALHWFRMDDFYAQVRRAARPGCIFAAWCYGLPSVDPAVDAVVLTLYDGVTGPYWPADRKWVDERYETIPFPFREITAPPTLRLEQDWSLGVFCDYIESWSASQRFKDARGHSPLERSLDDLAGAWGGADAKRIVTWPLHMRVGWVGPRG